MPKLYIVTGSSRGLGHSLCKLALEEGSHVLGVARGPATLQAPNYSHLQCDLSSHSFAEALARRLPQLLEAQLTDKPDSIILVNNAGVLEPVGPIAENTPEAIEKNIFVNLTAAIITTQIFVKHTKDLNCEKVIVNVTSGVAKNPKALWTSYSAAKAGLNAFSEALAKELAEKSNEARTKVICYEPGIIDTQMQAEIRAIPIERFPERDLFIKFKEDGSLRTADAVAQILMRRIKEMKAGDKVYYSVSSS